MAKKIIRKVVGLVLIAALAFILFSGVIDTMYYVNVAKDYFLQVGQSIANYFESVIENNDLIDKVNPELDDSDHGGE